MTQESGGSSGRNDSSQTGTAFDVAVVGGGPGGSTVATMLRKYAPELKVVVVERSRFPRDHVGESLLPVVSVVLEEMGCWEKIEEAGFPIKVGATYRWGSSDDLWDFDFLGGESYQDLARPGKYEGQRRKTAFQVDRARYDQILLDHARSAGAEVREETRVIQVLTEGDRIEGLALEDGSILRARYYVDATGHSGILRRSLGVATYEPTSLRNIAAWSYWQNAEWAVNIGVSGTRIQVMSLGWGWIWFIPLGPTRTSIGLVLPADYYKRSGKSLEELYNEALATEPRIDGLLRDAVREEAFHTTRDWSFVSSRMAGENWLLVGEAAGFADPILSAGLTLTHIGAWEAAIAITEMERGRYDREWIRSEFERQQERRIRTHIKFADYWYATNGHFTELIEYVREIAQESGLALDGANAWQWLGTGGFVDTDLGGAGVGGFSLVSAGWLVRDFSQVLPKWHVGTHNVFYPNLEHAEATWLAVFRPGHIDRIPGYRREGRTLPATDTCQILLNLVAQKHHMDEIVEAVRAGAAGCPLPRALQILEALVNDGWVTARYTHDLPLLDVSQLMNRAPFRKNLDNRPAVP